MTVKFNRKIWPAVIEAAKDSVAESAELIKDEVLHLVQDTPKSGAIYIHRGRGGPHQASAPGEPFANETGNALLNTKTYEENGGLKGRIAGEAEYALILETGSSRISPRPVFRPALFNKASDIVKVFQTNIRKAISKS